MFDQTNASESEASGNETTVPAWARLHREMKAATRRRCAWDAEHGRHLREAEAMRLWNHFGHVSILEYLEREHGIDPRTAHDRLRVSHALGELPLLEAELEDGSLQYSHVKELTRVVTPETEEAWIGAARGKTCAEVQQLVSGRKRGDGPDDPDDPDLRSRWLRVEMTPQMLAEYRTLRVAIESEMGHRLGEREVWQAILARAKAGGKAASTPAQISLCTHCGRGWQDGAGLRAELDPAEIACALCDGEHLGSVDCEQPGRKRPTLTDKKRARILARDHHRCTVPGCRSARNLDVHHLVHQERGGGHQDWNLTTLCHGHHLRHHRELLGIEGRAPHAIRFTWRQRNHDEDPAHVGANERQRAYGGPKVRQEPRGHAEPAQSRFGDAAIRTQAREALVALGWKPGIARAATDEAITHVGADVPIEAVIRAALRRCPKPLG